MIRTTEEQQTAIEKSMDALIEEYESLRYDLEHEISAQRSVENIQRHNWSFDKDDFRNKVNARLKIRLIRVKNSLSKASQNQRLSELQKQWFLSNLGKNDLHLLLRIEYH